MVPKPVSYDSYSSSDFEEEDARDEAPESITFSVSKGHAKKLRNARDAAVADAKRKVRDRRREIMQKTREEAQAKSEVREAHAKSEAEILVGGQEKQENDDETDQTKEEDVHAKKLQARMEQAMMDAQDEEDENLDECGLGGFEGGHDESKGSEDDHGSDEELIDDDNEADEVDDDDESERDTVKPDYLPDHLFASVLSRAEASSNTKKQLSALPISPAKSNRKAKKLSKSADIVVGSKTIRTTQRKHPLALAASRNKQPTKVKRFVDSSLGFKGNAKSRRKRSRQPANIGSMRSRNQPAVGFVRNS